jgi:hypothetical protein
MFYIVLSTLKIDREPHFFQTPSWRPVSSEQRSGEARGIDRNGCGDRDSSGTVHIENGVISPQMSISIGMMMINQWMEWGTIFSDKPAQVLLASHKLSTYTGLKSYIPSILHLFQERSYILHPNEISHDFPTIFPYVPWFYHLCHAKKMFIFPSKGIAVNPLIILSLKLP